jgi:hypothetical protein
MKESGFGIRSLLKVDFYQNQIFTEVKFLLDVYWNQNWISFTKNLFIETDFTIDLDYVYLGLIFLGIRLTAYSTVSDFFLGGT